jgi:hypothetical protein
MCRQLPSLLFGAPGRGDVLGRADDEHDLTTMVGHRLRERDRQERLTVATGDHPVNGRRTRGYAIAPVSLTISEWFR